MSGQSPRHQDNIGAPPGHQNTSTALGQHLEAEGHQRATSTSTNTAKPTAGIPLEHQNTPRQHVPQTAGRRNTKEPGTPPAPRSQEWLQGQFPGYGLYYFNYMYMKYMSVYIYIYIYIYICVCAVQPPNQRSNRTYGGSKNLPCGGAFAIGLLSRGVSWSSWRVGLNPSWTAKTLGIYRKLWIRGAFWKRGSILGFGLTL